MTTAKKCMFGYEWGVHECFTCMFTYDTRIENHRYRSDTRIRKYKELALCPDSPVSSLFVPLSTVSLSLPQNRTGGKWSQGSCQTFLFPCRKRKVRKEWLQVLWLTASDKNNPLKTNYRVRTCYCSISLCLTHNQSDQREEHDNQN